MRKLIALLVSLASGCSCGTSHITTEDAHVAADAFQSIDASESDASESDASQSDAPAPDSGPRCVIDDAIPVEPTGCCERQGQRCTRDCGSFVTFCDHGCCVFTGP